MNILVINAPLEKFDIIHFFFSKNAGVLAAVLIVLAFVYYREVKTNYVIEKYSHENNHDRIRGNIIVSIYVVVSFLSIFAVAFFRPGKL